MKTGSEQKRIVELDVFRGIAAFAVLLFHYTTRYDLVFKHSQSLWFFFPHGSYGFSLFFIISGYVIFMTLHKARSGTDFVVKRFSRLYPAYWTAILLTFSVVLTFGLPGKQVGYKAALVNFSMLQQFVNVPDVDGVYWTLQLELCFYAIMLVIYKLRLMDRIENLVIFWILLQAIAKGGVWVIPQFYVPYTIETLFLLKYIHLFIIGIIIYKISDDSIVSRKRLFIILLCILAQRFHDSWTGTMLIAAFVAMFFLMVKKKLEFIKMRPFIFLGTISYTLYLLHENIGFVIIRASYKYNLNPNCGILLATITSLVLATLVTFAVEKPAQRLIRGKYRKLSNLGTDSPSASRQASGAM